VLFGKPVLSWIYERLQKRRHSGRFLYFLPLACSCKFFKALLSLFFIFIYFFLFFWKNRVEFVGDFLGPIFNLLNRAERAQYRKAHSDDYNSAAETFRRQWPYFHSIVAKIMIVNDAVSFQDKTERIDARFFFQ